MATGDKKRALMSTDRNDGSGSYGVLAAPLNTSSPTSLTGVLMGDGSVVGTKTLDTSSLTNDNNHIPTSGVVKSALNTASGLEIVSATVNTDTVASNSTCLIVVLGGKNVIVFCNFKISAAGDANTVLATIPSGYRPSAYTSGVFGFYELANGTMSDCRGAMIRVYANGTVSQQATNNLEAGSVVSGIIVYSL